MRSAITVASPAYWSERRNCVRYSETASLKFDQAQSNVNSGKAPVSRAFSARKNIGTTKKRTSHAVPGVSSPYGARRLRTDQILELLLVLGVVDGLRVDLVSVREDLRRREDERVLRDRRIALLEDLVRADDRADVVDVVLDLRGDLGPVIPVHQPRCTVDVGAVRDHHVVGPDHPAVLRLNPFQAG